MRVYVHVPFCQTKCTYCPFYRYGSDKGIKSYVEATKQLMRMIDNEKKIETYYFGGGTPSVLEDNLAELVVAVLKEFPPEKGYDMTVESNVRHLTRDYLELLKDSGVTRISLGIQSFETERRKSLGRRSPKEKIIKAVEAALDIGLTTNVDLLYNLSGQTEEDFISDIRLAASLGIDSMSHYSLTLFEDTVMHKLIVTGKLPRPLGKIRLQKAGWEEAERLGYEMWNIKNFGLPYKHIIQGYEPKEMIPLGCGGVGLLGMQRVRVHTDFDRYIEDISQGYLPYTYEPMSNTEWYSKILKAMIKQREVDILRLGERFEIDPNIHVKTLAELSSLNLIIISKGKLRLLDEGVLQFDEVVERLRKDLEK